MIYINELFKVVNDFKQFHEKGEKVVDYRKPAELKQLIDLSLGDSHSRKELGQLVEDYAKYSVKTGHKQYLNQLFSGFNEGAVLGEVLAALMNSSMYTYEVSPVASLIETEVIAKMNSYAGFENGDGIFTTGGSNSNMLAMLCARHQKCPDIKQTGFYRRKPLSAFVSERAHYSFEKGAYLLGLGSDYLYSVKTDDLGQIIPEELEKAINESLGKGEEPFFIAATASTTELGAFDPIDKMNDVAKRYDCWLHVDGSWGGSIILSKTHRHLFDGLEKADSFAWNAHKLMNTPLIASALLVKDHSIMHNAVSATKTDYIFHEHDDQNYDLGTKSLACGRRNDALKVWMAWKAIGDEQYEKNIDKLMDLAQYAGKIVENHPNLELLAPVQSLNINFRYRIEDESNINDFNIEMREQLLKSGKSMVNYCHLKDKVSIRLVLVNHELEKDDIDVFFANIVSAGKELEATYAAQSINA